jgi:hypothetical protein
MTVQQILSALIKYGLPQYVGGDIADNGGTTPPSFVAAVGDVLGITFTLSVRTMYNDTDTTLGAWDSVNGWQQDGGWDGSTINADFLLVSSDTPAVERTILVVTFYDNNRGATRTFPVVFSAGDSGNCYAIGVDGTRYKWPYSRITSARDYETEAGRNVAAFDRGTLNEVTTTHHDGSQSKTTLGVGGKAATIEEV